MAVAAASGGLVWGDVVFSCVGFVSIPKYFKNSSRFSQLAPVADIIGSILRWDDTFVSIESFNPEYLLQLAHPLLMFNRDIPFNGVLVSLQLAVAAAKAEARNDGGVSLL